MTPTNLDDRSHGVAKPSARGRIKLRAHYRNLTWWTLRSWLTMFYLASGYAKLTEPTALLGVLMTWPHFVDPVFVRTLGGLELVMALAFVLSLAPWLRVPSIFNWALAFSTLESLAFFLFHAVECDIDHMLINAILVTLSVILFRSQKRDA